MIDRITDKDLMELARDLNEFLEEAETETTTGGFLAGSENLIGRFKVVPTGWTSGIAFESWGPSWDADCDERPEQPSPDPDKEPEPIPLREHMLTEMEDLGLRVLKFVELARRADKDGGQLDPPEPLADQIKRLADCIMHEVPGEPSQSQGAVDTATRLLRKAYVTTEDGCALAGALPAEAKED